MPVRALKHSQQVEIAAAAAEILAAVGRPLIVVPNAWIPDSVTGDLVQVDVASFT